MPNLLLELFSEEIPARMQAKAAENLKKLVTDALVDAGLVYESAGAFVTPRRLTLSITGIPATQPDTREERKGPRVGAPEKAVEGFLRASGLTSIDQATVQSDPKKGDFYVAITQKKGESADKIIADIIPAIIRKFPWPKSMKWGSGSLRWVRPLHSVLCLLGEGEDAQTVAFKVGDVTSGNTTQGHRFMAPEAFSVTGFEDYEAKLEKAHVILDAGHRRDTIAHDAKQLAFAKGLELVEDKGLLAEVAGLVEWPVVMMGHFDEAFLEVPSEVLTIAMKSHQKCFSLRDPKTSKLANAFILVSNLAAKDGGEKIVTGNERVINARLSDAKFFWELDRGTTLAMKAHDLENVTFHEKLGTQNERVDRITSLTGEIAPIVGAEHGSATLAARLCKADLVTEMVGEFPDLQGTMGRYYAIAEKQNASVAQACEDHYKPQGPSDEVPTEPVSIAVALADKIDTLVGFWVINEKPTGSKDPYALRRAALGVIRIILENDLRLNLLDIMASAHDKVMDNLAELAIKKVIKPATELATATGDETITNTAMTKTGASISSIKGQEEEVLTNLMAFFTDRLKVHLRDRGIAHDLIDAVLSNSASDDLVMIVKRVEALNDFLKTEDGTNLLAGYKRAVNIVTIEEKKDGPSIEYSGEVDESFFEHDQEKILHAELQTAKAATAVALKSEDFVAAMAAMAPLRGPVDAFFDAVIVNADDPTIRRNRLCLLNQIRKTISQVADFSKIEG